MERRGDACDQRALEAVGRRAGLDAVGVAPARPYHRARGVIEERRGAGLHGGMAFTYRNPERSTDPSRVLPDARALVVGARRYRRAPVPHGRDRPTGAVARYAWRDHYADLRAALGAVAARLEDGGWRAVVVADDNALVDREAAWQAGLGWYGKNTTLLLPGLGAEVLLGSVVTDAPLAPAERAVPDGCGPCRRCVDACPTGALDTPGVLDARRCLAWLVQAPGVFPAEHRVALGDRLYGCDECTAVCPPNRRAARVDPPGRPEQDAEPEVDLLDLLAATDEELLRRHGRWYVPRREPRHLRRNALVVLGNIADGTDPRVGAALLAALADDDPLVRAHAVWAARRLGRDDLLGAVERDADPLVTEELARPAVPRAPGSA